MKEHSQSAKAHAIRRKRPVIFWIFIVIAIPTTIYTALYSAGYRYDAESQSITRTAAVSIITVPKNADVYMNDVKQKDVTPFIRTVPGGTYTIRMEKDGYQSWSKTLSVTPGKSIVLPDVVLFYTTPLSVSLESATTQNIQDAFDRQLTPASLENNASLRATIQDLGFENADAVTVYSGGARDILVDEKNQKTYFMNGLKKEELKDPIDGVITHAQWIDRNTLVYSLQSELWVYTLHNKSFDLLLRQTDPITSIAAHGNGSIYYFTDAKGVYAIEQDPRDRRQQWKLLSEADATIVERRAGGRILILEHNGTQQRSAFELYGQTGLF